LILYPVAVESYPDKAAEDFAATVLPRLRSWLNEQFAKPETAVLGQEKLIVEWTAGEHRYHTTVFR